jgi:signal transduction histidine kinase
MYAERITLTRLRQPSLSERVRLVTMVVGVALIAAAASTALQWPLWRINAPLAGVNTLLAAAHAAIAPLLHESAAGDPRRQPIPWAFGIAGVCRAGSWINSWHPNDPVLNLLGHLLNSSFWVLVIAALLLWSRQRPNRWERRFVILSAVLLYGGDLLMAATDYAFAARTFAVVTRLLLIVLFFALALHRLRGARDLERRALRTAQIPALIAIPAAIVTGLAGATGMSPSRFLISTALGIALLAMPLTMVVAMARLAAERAEVADSVAGLAWPANPHRLRSALRRALHDPTIELGYWVPDMQRFVDADGHPIAEPTPDRYTVLCDDERQGAEVAEGLDPPLSPVPAAAQGQGPPPLTIPENPYAAVAGVRPRAHASTVTVDPVPVPPAAAEQAKPLLALRSPVALLIGGAHHHLRPDLVTAALQAAGPALALATLQAGLQAERRDLAAVHREVEESRWAERRRLEQNLHDGAQHRLAALTMRLGAASATVPLDGRAKDLVGEIQDEIREVLRELREVADGIHPTALTEAGLGPALEAVAERFPVSVTITAPARRFPPVVEAVAYYSTTEVLTIVTRQLSAAEVRVEVSTRGGDLWVRMTGTGVDARGEAPGRYLAPLGSGIRAIGGELLLPATEGSAFTVAARIPCE